MAPPSSSLIFILFFFVVISTSFILLTLYSINNRRSTTPNKPIKNQEPQQQRQGEKEELDSAVVNLPPPPSPPPLTEEKRKKKKGKKKQQQKQEVEVEEEEAADAGRGAKCPYPFSSFASAMQRKIKAQYDDIVKSNEAKSLSIAQVGQFVNCLVDARNELQHKYEIIQRSFKIQKALLVRADRSSFDRHCQQMYKLEKEHKRLEEDAAVYNLLQEQLKLSPAYKMMLEISARRESEDNQDQVVDFCEISFDEFLAQEKKDSFWQRNPKLRSSAK